VENAQFTDHNAPVPLPPSPALYARHRAFRKPELGTAADSERSELDIVGFALIDDVDALDSCGGRTTVDSLFAATVSG